MHHWLSCRAVDSEILSIVRQRFEDCMLYEAPDHLTVCKPLWEKYKDAEEAWFIKCKYNFDANNELGFRDSRPSLLGLVYATNNTNMHAYESECYKLPAKLSHHLTAFKLDGAQTMTIRWPQCKHLLRNWALLVHNFYKTNLVHIIWSNYFFQFQMAILVRTVMLGKLTWSRNTACFGKGVTALCRTRLKSNNIAAAG